MGDFAPFVFEQMIGLRGNMKRLRLTRNRAEKIVNYIVPFIYVNLECDEGDLLGYAHDWTQKDIDDFFNAVLWINEQAERFLEKTKK